MERELITIGFNKDGEADFGIRGDVIDLSLEQMQELRAMIPVAIWCAENIWRQHMGKEDLPQAIPPKSIT